MTSNDQTRDLLREAQQLHGEGRIEEALGVARQALDADPGSSEAMTYLGTTLITRFMRFQEGLDILERAAEVAPDDAGVWYSLGWCQEFVAYRLSKLATTPYRDPFELWELATASLQRCIDLNPELGLREDAEDLQESITPRLE